MDPILSKQVKRGNNMFEEDTLKEWESAADQATDDGRNAFAKRQRDRMEAVARARAMAEMAERAQQDEVNAKVLTINKRRPA